MRRAILLMCSAAALSTAAPPVFAQGQPAEEGLMKMRQMPRPSLAELRAAHRAAEKRLAEAAATAHAKWREAEGAPELRAPLREAVAELFDARQRLQARELEELRRRVERLDTLLGDRANRRDLLIDARTDELLEHGLPAAPQVGQTSNQTLEAQGSAIAGIDRQKRRQWLERAFQEAEAGIALEQEKYERAKALLADNAVGAEIVDEQAARLRAAKSQHDHIRVELEALGREPGAGSQDARAGRSLPGGSPGAYEASQVPDARQGTSAFSRFDRQTQDRLLKLELQEAESDLALAQKRFERMKGLERVKAIEVSVVEEQEARLTQAKLRVERLKVQLDALRREPASEAKNTGAAGKAQDEPSDDEARARKAEELKLRIEEYERNLKRALEAKDRVQASIDQAQKQMRSVASGTPAYTRLSEPVKRANEDLDRVLKGLKETQAMLAGARVELKRLEGSFPFGPALETSRSETAAESNPDLQRQLLELDVEEAKAAAAAAADALKAAHSLHAPLDTVRTREAELTRAKFQVQRAQIKLNAFVRRDSERPVEDDPELQRQIFEVDVEEAKAALAGAEQQLEYAAKMHRNGFLTDLEVQSRESALPRAKLELKKAEARLETFLRAHPDQAAGSQATGEGQGTAPTEAKP